MHLDRTLSALADGVMRAGSQINRPSPGTSLLAPHRRAARRQVAARLAPITRALLAAGERERFEAEVGAGLETMRRVAVDLAARRGRVSGAVARVDHWWASTDAREHIDDAGLDPALRRRAMDTLDRVNAMIGSYEAFFELLEPALAAARVTDGKTRPLRVIDLAAGHGGFALALGRAARRRGAAIEITATDIKPEYLALARDRAEAEALPVRFAVQDALDLGGVAPGAYDVVTCTQALHHFTPGQVATMMSEAARVAGLGVVFIDGARTVMHGPPLYAYLRIREGDAVLAHDGWVSCRRFFAPEELALIADLALPAGQAEVRWAPPSHCAVTIKPERAS